MQINNNQRLIDAEYRSHLIELWNNSNGKTIDKLKSFTKFVPYTEFPKLFAKYEIFKSILNVHGSIIECGVHQGAGLFTWGVLSSIFEPVNHVRKIIGFDTFEGFPNVDANDKLTGNLLAAEGSLSASAFEEIEDAIRVFNIARPLNHINKIELVKGDACETIPNYLEKNPHTVVSLLYLDFDLFKPTKIAIEHLLPRMPKGSVVVFDELNIKDWPGETLAVMQTLGIRNLRINRFHFHPQISYAILD